MTKTPVADLLAISDDSSTREVFGDASYGIADVLEMLESAGVEATVKVQPPPARGGMLSHENFSIDVKSAEASCPAGARVALRLLTNGLHIAEFGKNCDGCALRSKCTDSKIGRTLKLHQKHELLSKHRKRQRDEIWKTHYRKVRPRVERKIAHLMRRSTVGRATSSRARERTRQAGFRVARGEREPRATRRARRPN